MIKDEKTDVARGMCTEKGLSAQIKIAKQAKGGGGKADLRAVTALLQCVADENRSKADGLSPYIERNKGLERLLSRGEEMEKGRM